MVEREHLTDFAQQAQTALNEQIQALECRLQELDSFVEMASSLNEDSGGNVEIYPEEYMGDRVFTNVISVRMEAHLQSLEEAEQLLSHSSTVDNSITVTDDGVYYVETQHEIGNGCI